MGNAGPGAVTAPPINILQAGSGLSGAVMTMGDSSAGTAQWGVKIKGLTVDCHNISGCIGIVNNTAQEDSTVEDVIVENAPSIGLSIVASCSIGCNGAVNSGPYRNVTVQYISGGCGLCGSSTIGILVTGLGDGKVIRGLDNITVSANHMSNGKGIVINRASTRVSNSHVEYYPTGIQIGGTLLTTNNTRGGQIQNVSIGNASTSNITITQYASDIVLEGIDNRSSSVVLTDNATGNTLTSPEDDFLAIYSLGHTCTATCPNQTYPAVITTSPSVQVQIPGGVRTP